MLNGPKSSSGTENRVSKRSKYDPPSHKALNLRPSSDFAVPGGPSNNKCSPQHAAKSNNRTSVSRSINPDSNADVAAAILPAKADRVADADDEDEDSDDEDEDAPLAKIGFNNSATRPRTASSSADIAASCSRCRTFHSGSDADDDRRRSVDPRRVTVGIVICL